MTNREDIHLPRGRQPRAARPPPQGLADLRRLHRLADDRGQPERRSMTRAALPALRGSAPAGTSSTSIPIPVRSRSASCTRARRSSEPASAASQRTLTSSDAPGPLDGQLVVRRDALDPEQDVLDLRGIDVDAAQDQHVVAAAVDRAHAGERAPARARRRVDGGDVGRAVAQQRQRLLRQRRDHELARLARRDRLAPCRGRAPRRGSGPR